MQSAPAMTPATVLLEREGELQQLDRLVEEAANGLGRCVLVEGPPGIGKTRLLEAARARSRRHQMTVLSARPSELEREFPFGVVRQLYEPLLGSSAPERRAALLKGAAGLAAPVLGHGEAGGGTAPPGDDPSPAHFHALYWLTANLAEQAPATLAIDDLHWADASSLRFLRFLLPRLEELPVLVALAARPAEPAADPRLIDALATDPATVVLRPAPLTESAVSMLVSATLGSEGEPAFCEACGEATGGNPFLLRELLGELQTEGVRPSTESVALVRQLAPATVTRTVLLRLARLGDDASSLARAIAVLGDGASLRQAAALAALAQERAAELAAALAESDILTSARPMSFAHPMLRSAVYADIDPAERARCHRRAAALLAEEGAETEAVAVHLLATEPAADAYVTGTLRDAARRALARGAAATAVTCLRRALAEPPELDDRVRVLLELASAELNAGDPAAATGHFEDAAGLPVDPGSRALHAWDRALALQALGRHDEAFAIRERAVEEVEGAEPGLARLLEASLVASARFDLARLDWARERLNRRRGRLTGATPPEQGLLVMQAHLDAFTAGSDTPSGALADVAEAALESETALDSMSGLGTPFFSAIDVLGLADRLEPARRALDRSVDDARRRGSAPRFAFALGARCALLSRQGALVEAEADARRCVELALPQGLFVMGPVILGLVLGVLIDRGELDDARQVLERSGMAERPADNDLTFDPVVHARARLRAAAGDLDGGRADLASLRRRRARWNTYPSLLPALLVAPELAEEDPGEVQRMLADARAWGTPRAIGMALRTAGLAEGGERGLELLEEAAAVLEPSPARLAHAGALVDLGAALRRANRRAAARDPLRRALDLADACGARPLAERARQELRAAGGRPRRPRVSGVDSLTASERRIAGLAADGLSTPEIAQALFITKKTVETHLGNVYRKLDIHSRAELPGAFDT